MWVLQISYQKTKYQPIEDLFILINASYGRRELTSVLLNTLVMHNFLSILPLR
jgi:hypothetical protein